MPNRIGLPIAVWPAADRAAWQRATSKLDYFSDDGVAARWREKSRNQASYAYGRWLAWLQGKHPDALSGELASRVTPEHIRTYAAQLATRITPMSVAAELQHLWLAMKALAPTSDWAWLAKIQYRWAREARPRERRHRMVDPRRLLELGFRLMDSASDAELAPRERARQFRDGLLIALLVVVPLRRRSLTALQLDKQVRRIGNGFRITLAPEDTKAGHAVDFDVPTELTNYITRYLADYRPIFPGARTSKAMWLSSKPGVLGGEAIYDLVCRRTLAAFGVTVYPHLFRTITATTIAREAPDKIAIARDLLTHSKLDTTVQHYIQAQTVRAGRDHAALIARLRAQSTGPHEQPSIHYPATDAVDLLERGRKRKA